MTHILIKRGNLNTDINRWEMMWKHREKAAIYKPKTQTGNRYFPHGVQKELTLQNSERISVD